MSSRPAPGHRAPVRPTGVERLLGPDELIVTKTDLQGRIVYANETFLRISALDEEQTLGQPHSIIRHPDMPRAVFAELWETIGDGRELFAFIKNLGTDGAHYWVLAHVTASRDARGRVVGYHSNRREPYRAALAEVEEVYAEVRRAEQGLSGRAAATAGRERLTSLLEARGLTFSSWVWSLEGGE